MQPFYSIAAEWRIRQWLEGGVAGFSEYSEEDAKIVEDYANTLIGAWPSS
jgi:hypothetical protein